MSAASAFVLSHQLAITFAASILILAGMVIQELSAKRRLDRLDAEARERYPEASGQLAAALESSETAGRQP